MPRPSSAHPVSPAPSRSADAAALLARRALPTRPGSDPARDVGGAHGRSSGALDADGANPAGCRSHGDAQALPVAPAGRRRDPADVARARRAPSPPRRGTGARARRPGWRGTLARARGTPRRRPWRAPAPPAASARAVWTDASASACACGIALSAKAWASLLLGLRLDVGALHRVEVRRERARRREAGELERDQRETGVGGVETGLRAAGRGLDQVLAAVGEHVVDAHLAERADHRRGHLDAQDLLGRGTVERPVRRIPHPVAGGHRARARCSGRPSARSRRRSGRASCRRPRPGSRCRPARSSVSIESSETCLVFTRTTWSIGRGNANSRPGPVLPACAGVVADQASPAQHDRDLVGPDHGDAGDGVQQRHRGDPPVHPPPGGVEQARERRGEPAELGRRAEPPHFGSWLWSREKGSASVRRIRLVSLVTS